MFPTRVQALLHRRHHRRRLRHQSPQLQAHELKHHQQLARVATRIRPMRRTMKMLRIMGTSHVCIGTKRERIYLN